MIPTIAHKRPASGQAVEVDPTTLPLTLCLEAPFAGSPWEGIASTDTSGSHNMVTGDAAPTVGAELTYESADFDGTQNLVGDGFKADAVIDPAGFYLGVVFKGRSWPEASGINYAATLAGDPGTNFGMVFSGSLNTGGIPDGVTAYVREDIADRYYDNAINAPCGRGDFHFAQMWCDGEKIGLDVDGTTVESGPIDLTWFSTYVDAWDINVGKNYYGFLDGNVRAVYAAKTPFDAATRAGLLRRAITRFEVLPSEPYVRSVNGTFPGPSDSTGWNPRDGAAMVRLPSGRVLFIGGWSHLEKFKSSLTPATTGSITMGSDSLVVASAAGLTVGNEIGITGVRGMKQITAIVGTTVTLNSVANVTVAGADVFLTEVETTNEVWASDDEGVTWELLLAHDPAPPAGGPGARFKPAHARGVVMWNGICVVMGSDHYPYPNQDLAKGEVWHSNADGTEWTCVASAALNDPDPPPPMYDRVLSIFGTLGDDIYMIGGQPTENGGSATAFRDMWKSTNGGVTWSVIFDEATPLPWGNDHPRCMVYNAVEHHGELYVVTGGTYGYGALGSGLGAGEYTSYNGVFAFDGATWRTVLADGNGQLPNCDYASVASWDDKLWLINGYHYAAGQEEADSYYSDDDGETWTYFKPRIGGPGSHANSVVALPDRLLFVPGAAHELHYRRNIYAVQRRTVVP